MSEGYRETVRAIRQIGRDCINQRLKAISNEEEVPNDILTQIIRVARSDASIDIEDLVDDFATFYIAGMYTGRIVIFHHIDHPHTKRHIVATIG